MATKATSYDLNAYMVPKAGWRSFGPVGQPVFNEVYRSMTESPWAFQAGKTWKDVSERAWKTAAWNAAWIAATAARDAARECST